jgi:DNA replication ATP-dependent helicase Dna2
MLQGGTEGSSIGVIAPFRAQVALLQKMVASNIDKDVEVNTVDQYQGRDKDIIIFSCAKTENITSASKKLLPAENKVYPKFLLKLCLR